jgi:hypothetical protein
VTGARPWESSRRAKMSKLCEPIRLTMIPKVTDFSDKIMLQIKEIESADDSTRTHSALVALRLGRGGGRPASMLWQQEQDDH